MKGSNSRLNFDPARRWSGVLAIQGGMITDSDLAEAAAIGLARDEAQSLAFARSGVPAEGGMLTEVTGDAALREGTVFAEGKQGHFRLAQAVEPGNLEAALKAQADFPEGPGLQPVTGLLYADVWERAVFAVQDPSLTDAGLHGTETGYRTRTMVQVKQVETNETDPDAIAKLMADHPAFLRRGTARAVLKPADPEVIVDNCDPCADQVTADQTLPNALFRLEIVSVARKADGTPTAIGLAWSLENAAVVERNTAEARVGLKRDPAAYQFFSDVTEAHQGWLPSASAPAFTEALDTAPVAGDPGGFPYVRRWDGHARVELSPAKVTGRIGSGKPTLDGKTVVVPTEFFSLTLPLDAEYLVGDYWLVELRRFAPAADRLRLVGDDGTGALPQGILHHFCPLALLKDGKPTAQPGWLSRVTSFPPLSDLPASHVSYAPPEGCALFDGAETVQTALDRICGIEATEVHFTPDPGCETLKDTHNVHDALMALCKADNDRMLRLMLRTMMDWGVVCGLRTTLASPEKISVTGGVALDRLGELRELPAQTIDLRAIAKEALHGDLPALQKLHGDLCLSLAFTPDGVEWHISGPDFPFTADDLTVRERIEACLAQRDSLDTGAVLGKLSDEEKVVLNRIHLAWTNRDVLAATMELSEKDLALASRLFDRLRAEFDGFASASGKATLEALLKRAETEFGRSLAAAGDAVGVRRMQAMVAQFGLLALVEERDKIACRCDNALPVCPDPKARLALVPIACIRLTRFDAGALAADEVCDFCCRKTSQNWRSFRYYMGDAIGGQIKEVSGQCCDPFAFANTEAALDAWAPGADLLASGRGSPFWPPDPGVTNLAERSGPDVRGLTIERAMVVLKGAGIAVDPDRHIDLDKQDVFARLVEMREADPTVVVGIDYQAKQGDTVAFLTSGGTVRDIHVTRQAFWKGFFDFGSLVDLMDKTPDLAGLKAVQDRLTLLEAAKPLPDPRIADLEKRLDTLSTGTGTIDPGLVKSLTDRISVLERAPTDSAEVKTLRDKVAVLEARPAADTTALETELAGLRRQNEALVAANREAQGTITTLNDSVKRMEAAVLKATPVEDVLDAPTAKVLRERGITTKGQLDSTSSALLGRALTGTGVTAASVLASSRNFKL